MMEIAVVGPSEFTLGFQLAGVSEFHNPEGEEETVQTFRDLLSNKAIGIVVVDSAIFASLPERLRERASASITPTVLGIGVEEDNSLRETIRKAIGVDLWK
ncbi:MAG: V-type ATP synthase subunit F [Zetaproteobacteria bacterium]|nr:V-type ATP synthase subunit F [Pseudobdellovibrionaceae bacterium]